MPNIWHRKSPNPFYPTFVLAHRRPTMRSMRSSNRKSRSWHMLNWPCPVATDNPSKATPTHLKGTSEVGHRTEIIAGGIRFQKNKKTPPEMELSIRFWNHEWWRYNCEFLLLNHSQLACFSICVEWVSRPFGNCPPNHEVTYLAYNLDLPNPICQCSSQKKWHAFHFKWPSHNHTHQKKTQVNLKLSPQSQSHWVQVPSIPP